MILELLQKGDIKQVYEILSRTRKQGVEEFKKEFNNDRNIRNTQVGKREMKKNGDSVSKIPIAFQKKIVNDASAFILGSPVKLVAPENTEDSKLILDLWKKLRMDSLLLKFCKAVKSETEAAFVFFTKKDGEGNLSIKSRVLTSDNGILYPYLDAFGDMQAFGWEFTTMENKKAVKNLYVFTNDAIEVFKQTGGDWIKSKEHSTVNFFKKIPVVYHSQNAPEWEDVKELIDRFEMSFSKFCDTNDYFSAPMFKASGAVGKPPKKDDTGRLVNLEITETASGNVIQGDLDYLTWDHAPEATKLEFQTTKELIYGLSSTPDLTLEAVKGIGQIANAGMKLMFLAPILKAKDSEGDYRTVIERLINVMKAGLKNILTQGSATLDELEFDIQFTSPLPENIKELVDVLMDANGGKPILSQSSSVSINPLVENPDTESELLNKEKEEDSISDLGASAL